MHNEEENNFNNFDPQQLSQIFTQIGSFLSNSTSETINWKLAEENAQKVIKANNSNYTFEHKNIESTLRLAQLWVDQATSFPNANLVETIWTQQEWLENTMETWQYLANPVANAIANGLAKALAENIPKEMGAMFANAEKILKNIGGGIFGTQFGQAIGALACEVLSTTDIGIPLVKNKTAIIPQNIAKFSEGLEISTEEIILFIAIRENAHIRLFNNVTWLSKHLLTAIEDYATGIEINTERLEQLSHSIDASSPEALQEALQNGMLNPNKTPQQQLALNRLETLLALIEGWVEEITAKATKDLKSSASLQEMIRRRKAVGGPAERTFTALVGLEIRPKQLRNASILWESLTEQTGVAKRDAIWEHPDLLPTLEDLKNPLNYKQKMENQAKATAEIDDALTEIFKNDQLKKTDPEPESGSGSGSSQT